MVQLNWNNLVRQIHRWLSIAFTLAVIANFVAMGLGEPLAWVVYSPLIPLFLLLFTGLYMFVQPYAITRIEDNAGNEIHQVALGSSRSPDRGGTGIRSATETPTSIRCIAETLSGETLMPNTVRLYRVLATKPDKVYRAFIEADAMAKWLPPNGFACTVHHSDAKVGGTFKMSFRNFTTGMSHSFGGEYLELVPGCATRTSSTIPICRAKCR